MFQILPLFFLRLYPRQQLFNHVFQGEIRDKVQLLQRQTCQGIGIVPSFKPLLDGFTLEGMTIGDEDRILHKSLEDGALKGIR